MHQRKHLNHFEFVFFGVYTRTIVRLFIRLFDLYTQRACGFFLMGLVAVWVVEINF